MLRCGVWRAPGAPLALSRGGAEPHRLAASSQHHSVGHRPRWEDCGEKPQAGYHLCSSGNLSAPQSPVQDRPHPQARREMDLLFSLDTLNVFNHQNITKCFC